MFSFAIKKSVSTTLIMLMLVPVDFVAAKSFIDPTRPPGVNEQKQSKSVVNKKSPWRLSSTLIASERKIATINGLMLRQGDRVNGATLISIQSWNVTLEKNKKKFKIYMFRNFKTRSDLGSK